MGAGAPVLLLSLWVELCCWGRRCSHPPVVPTWPHGLRGAWEVRIPTCTRSAAGGGPRRPRGPGRAMEAHGCLGVDAVTPRGCSVGGGPGVPVPRVRAPRGAPFCVLGTWAWSSASAVATTVFPWLVVAQDVEDRGSEVPPQGAGGTDRPSGWQGGSRPPAPLMSVWTATRAASTPPGARGGLASHQGRGLSSPRPPPGAGGFPSAPRPHPLSGPQMPVPPRGLSSAVSPPSFRPADSPCFPPSRPPSPGRPHPGLPRGRALSPSRRPPR